MNETKVSLIRKVLGGDKFGFGTYRLPKGDSGCSIVDQNEVNKMISLFLDNGHRYIETAYGYHKGKNQEIICTALNSYNRQDYLLAGKFPIDIVQSSEDYQRIFAEQLEKSQVDYFDFYLLHNIGGASYQKTERFGGFSFLKKLKEHGLARYVGFSFHDSAEMLDAVLQKYHEIVDFVQLQINYMDWQSPVIQSGKCYETACKYGLPVFVMEPAKGGRLAELPKEAEDVFFEDDSEAAIISWSYRFAASLENVVLVLSGMSNYQHVYENMAVFAPLKPLSEEEFKTALHVGQILRSANQIQCTNCGYCLSVCPVKIPIPDILHLLENDNSNSVGRYYQRLCYEKGRASDCLKCGKCEDICSQRISIRKYLTQAADRYELQFSRKIELNLPVGQLKDKTVYIFGAGKYGKLLYEELKTKGVHIKAFIDNDPQKQGQMIIDGKLVIDSDTAFSKSGESRAVLVSPVNNADILEQLKRYEIDMIYDLHGKVIV